MKNVRAIVNDSFAGATNTAGEGQIVTDSTTPIGGSIVNNPMVLNHLNSSIRTLYRKLRIIGDPTLIGDNYVLFGLPSFAGTQPEPATQCYLDNDGFWDGAAYHNQFKLPKDMLEPIRLWERSAGTTDTFQEMNASTNGLSPRDQMERFVDWEWRNGRINFVGATQPRDLRIRYTMVFPTFFQPALLNFATTFIPILDCEEYVSYATAQRIALTLAAPSANQILMAEADKALSDLRNERVRRMQQITYQRRPYNDSDTAQELDVYGI